MIITQKAVPCVLKDLETDPQILCFLHPPPSNDFQIPKGTVEPGEAIENAVLRELQEESGIGDAKLIQKVGVTEWIIPADHHGLEEPEQQFWHIYHLEVNRSLPDQWLHTVTGEGGDAGLLFDYFWQPLYDQRLYNYHAPFLDVMDRIRSYLDVSQAVTR